MLPIREKTMNNVTVGWVTSAAVMLLVTHAYALDIPLNYERYPDDEKAYLPRGYGELKVSLERPQGEWKFPEFNSEQPVYAFAELTDGKRLLVLDRKHAKDRFYNRIYFDANHNRDLTDDRSIDGVANFMGDGAYCHMEFPAVDTTVRDGGRDLPFSFRPTLSGRKLGELKNRKLSTDLLNEHVSFSLRVNCSYSGIIQLDDHRYQLMLCDADCNGSFADRGKVPQHGRQCSCSGIHATGDKLYITDEKKVGYDDAQMLGSYLILRDRLFNIDIDIEGGKLTLSAVAADMAPLQLGMETRRLVLYTKDGKHCVTMYRPATNVMLLKGIYRLLDYQCMRKDEQGDLWQLLGKGSKDSPFVSVEGKEDAVLNFGEPYTFVVNFRSSDLKEWESGERKDLRLSLSIDGSGGDTVSGVTHVSGNKTKIELSKKSPSRPKEPTFKIMRADGEVIDSGSFEYG